MHTLYLGNLDIRIGKDIGELDIEQPRIPIVFQLIRMAKKGCSSWAKLLKTRYKLDDVHEMERKQEARLMWGCFTEIANYGHTMQLNDFDCYEVLFIEKTRTCNYKTFFFMIYIKYFVWCARCKK